MNTILDQTNLSTCLEFDRSVIYVKMACKWLLILFYLIITFYQIVSLESLLQCWRCEVTVQSTEQIGVFLDGMC